MKKLTKETKLKNDIKYLEINYNEMVEAKNKAKKEYTELFDAIANAVGFTKHPHLSIGNVTLIDAVRDMSAQSRISQAKYEERRECYYDILMLHEKRPKVESEFQDLI